MLGPDNVHDALPHVVLGVVFDAEILGVLFERVELTGGFKFGLTEAPAPRMASPCWWA